uniref:Nuclear pore complex protein NUP1 n=1 Tax=Oryza meridionalis TaxID=40149 RepID=A0A0E0D7Y4_9ORYZ
MRLLWSMHLPMLISSTKQILGRPLHAEDAYPPQGGGGGGGWVSRLVDPASRLIAGGAARLFSTVFRKRLDPAPAPAPPKSTPHGSDNEPNQGLPESTQTGSKLILEKGKNPTGTSDNKALSEVEHLVEFDRLTDLLRARTVESDLSAPADNLENKNEARNTIDGIGGSTSHGMAADHSIAADDPVCGASSPTELAKQYMNSRYSKENRPNSLRSQVLLKNKAEASNIAYDRRRPGGPFVQELSQFSNENSELPVNGYVTPGLRGRSAIYRMSCSPFFKGPSSSNDINMSPFSSSQTWANSLVSGGRQVLKRRGTELENELGSIGPIRRIRQKSNMMSTFRDARSSPRGNFLPSRTIGSDLTDGGSPIRDSPSSKRLLLGMGQSVEPAEARRNDEDGKISSDNVLAASPQSNKMAEKIFEQLNIIVPSPKEKLSLPQFAAGNASCSMSKQPVRQGNEPNGGSDPSSSQKFQPMDSVKCSLDPELNGSPSSKDKLRKDGSSKLLSHSFKDLGNKDIKSDNVALSSVAATTSSKPGFKMAVFEDLPEFDDDQEAPVPSKNSMGKTEVKTTDKKIDLKKEQKVEPILFKQKVESNSVQKAVSSPVSEKPIASALKDARPLGLFSPNDPENRATHDVPSDNNNGFKFPHVPSGTLLESSVSQVPLASNKDDKLISASSSILGLKQSSTPDSEQTNTASVKTEARLGESVTKPMTLDVTNLEGGNERERTEELHKSSDKVLPSAAPFHFASAASTTASLSNGFSLPSSSKLSNVTPIDKPAVCLAPSTVSTTFAPSSTSPPVSSPIPAIPTFNFGSSTSMVAATKSDSTNTVAKPASSLLFGTGDAIAEAKSTAQDTANKASSNLSTTPISSNISSSPVTSSSAFSSIATFSSSTVAASNDGIASTTSASTAPFTFSSSGNNTFGFNSPAQSAGFSTSVDGSTTQPSATSTIFGSKLPQSEGTMSQPSKSSPVQFSSPFQTVTTTTGASSSGSGSVAFGVGTASTGSGITSFGTGASSSGPSTVSFGLGASSSGTGALSFGAGASSSGTGALSFGAGASSSGTGALSFGAGASSSGTGALSFGAGAGTSSSGPGTVSFGAGTTSSGPGTVPFGVTTSSSGSLFGNSPFGSGTTFSGPGSGFAFSSPSSSAGSSLTMASTSMFSSSSTASSSPAFSNPFGSSSSPPSMFTFGQSASSGGGFSFGAQSSPAFSSQAPVFSFTSASMNSSTPQPAFGMTNANTAFGMGSPGNDQMNVEDSMADDTNQAAPAPAPAPIFGSSPFGQPASSPAAPVFGAPAVPSAGVFQFGGQQGSMQQNAAFPPAGGSLEFQGGNFSLGSGGGGGDKSSRRVIKVKRNPKKR